MERNGRGVRLTDAAGLLAEHAERILALVETAEADFEALRGEVVGRLNMAAFPTAARGLDAARAGRAQASATPTCGCSSTSASRSGMVREVARGELDLGVVQDWLNRPMAHARGTVPGDAARRHRRRGRARRPSRWPAEPRSQLADLPATSVDQLHARHGLPRLAGLHAASARSWSRGSPAWPTSTRPSSPWSPPGSAARSCPGWAATACPRASASSPCGRRQTRRIYAIWRTDAARRPAIRAAVDALRAAADALRPATDALRPGRVRCPSAGAARRAALATDALRPACSEPLGG